MKCPGQDTRYWKPDSIFEIDCPNCGHTIEFFKDDTTRICPSCGQKIRNPKIDLGCAQYCPYAKQCLGEFKKIDINEDQKLLEIKTITFKSNK